MEKQSDFAQVNAKYSHSGLLPLAEPQLIHAIVEMMPLSGHQDQPSRPLNVCMAIDCSTSMQGLRMDMVKEAAIELVRRLRPQDILSIVSFNDRAEVRVSPAPNQERARVETAIRMLQTGGGTEIFHGLETAFSEARLYFRPGAINHVVLITDGHTYGDEERCLRLTEQNAGLGIALTGLGIGDQWNDEFLDALAAFSGSTSMYLSKPADIQKILHQKFNIFWETLVEGILYEMKTGPGVVLRDAFRLAPDPASLLVSSPLRLGSIQRDGLLSFLLEFVIEPVPPGSLRVVLSQGDLQMQLPDRPAGTASIPLLLSRPVLELPDQAPPAPEVVDALNRINLYRLQDKARQDIDAGDFTRATRRMRDLATHLLARGDRQLAETVLIEADRLQQEQPLSQDGKKQIKYGTRALVLPPGSDDPEV